jgi:SAM-dependent methyltransferase
MRAAREGLIIDTTVPHPARRYNYWLGGKDNFAADRESGDAIAVRWPDIVFAVRENRAFLQRAVHYAATRGIRQWLDIGTGLPTADNTHEVAQRVDPASRIVYVDNDPLVLVHARALLNSTPQGATAYIDADLRDPKKILADPDLSTTLGLKEPVALNLVAILHFVHDNDQAYAVVETLKDALAPGSLLVLSHGSYDLMPRAHVQALTSGDYPGQGDFHARTHNEVSRYFDRFELVAPDPEDPNVDLDKPELGLVSDWGRAPGEERPPPQSVSTWGAVARKPEPRPTGVGPPRASQRQAPVTAPTP